MDTLTVRERSERMSRIRGKDTSPELRVRTLVHGAGYRYRKHRRDLPGCPDLVFRKRRKVIFVHGCFWHRHQCALGRLPKSRLGFWQTKLEANRIRDQRILHEFCCLGWEVLTIWECEIGDAARVLKRVRIFLDAQR